MKRIAYVLSDFSFPVQEGLHEQSFINMKRLQRLGYDLDVYVLAKKSSEIDIDLLRNELKTSLCVTLKTGRGPLVLQSLLAVIFRHFPRSRFRELRKRLVGGGYNLYHFDGILACSLSPVNLRLKSVLSLVDPGSRRYLRFSRTDNDNAKKLASLLAAAAYYCLEHMLRQGSGYWHVVSQSDAEYLAKVHNYKNVIDIPVSLPLAFDVTPIVTNSADSSEAVTIVIYCDLRQSHMQNALEMFADHVLPKSLHAASCRILVLGRTQPSEHLRSKFDNYDVVFYSSVDNFISILSSADIVLLPDSVGTGLKNRTVQSMALGKAVLATSVALEGISRNIDRACLRLDGTEGSRNLDKMILDRDLRYSLGESAQFLVSARFGEAPVGSAWQGAYETMSRRF